MRQCIFCKRYKEEIEFNKEHIILEALGGKGSDDLCFNVCTSCNSMLGARVDASLLNQKITEKIRYLYKIKGKNGVPNPFKGIEINYADTPVKGEIKTDKYGNINGFRAKHQVIKQGEYTLIAGSKKGFEAYVNSQLKKNGLAELPESEIKKNKIDFGTPKIPHAEKMIFSEEMKNKYLCYAFPAILKMSYEYCFTILGEEYLQDPLAEEIRVFIMNFDYKMLKKWHVPTYASLQLNRECDMNRKICLNIYAVDNKVYVRMNLWGFVESYICMSEEASRYNVKINNKLELEI